MDGWMDAQSLNPLYYHDNNKRSCFLGVFFVSVFKHGVFPHFFLIYLISKKKDGIPCWNNNLTAAMQSNFSLINLIMEPTASSWGEHCSIFSLLSVSNIHSMQQQSLSFYCNNHVVNDPAEISFVYFLAKHLLKPLSWRLGCL